MDISASQYNSASESGWTHYLDQSSLYSENYFQRRNNIVDDEEGGGTRIEEDEEFEEDLSMISDASSGPPHYDDAPWYSENWYSKESSSQKKKKMVKEYGKSQQKKYSHLDDTASSPVFNFPKESHHKNKVSFSGNGAVEDAIDFSQCLSATRIKRKPKFQKHFRGKQASEEPGGFDEE